MSLLMEPGQTYNSWDEFKAALDAHCKENHVLFNVGNTKTVEQSNAYMKKGPFFAQRLKYSHCVLRCKHYGSYTSTGAGLRPKQRSYKIDCGAFINISACRKEDYLIIRDSFHKHSHPCTEEIYNSYPEVRRMTKDERRMVGTLMDLGVPVSHIKTAVGRNVTPKDLHNAKSHIRAVKMGLKTETRKTRFASKRFEHLRNRDEQQEVLQSEALVNSNSGKSVSNATSTETTQSADKQCNSQVDNSVDNSTASGDNDDSNSDELPLNSEENTSVSNTALTEGDSGEGSSETNSVSHTLNPFNPDTDSVIALPNNDGVTGDKTSYTVVVSNGDDNKGNSEVVENLQELFHKLKAGGFTKKATIRIPKTKILEQMQRESEIKKPPKPDEKNCESCGKYMSPLDGHSQCLACLGPEHLLEHDCEHCKAMKPEQLRIRRKLLVRMRMKVLKGLNASKNQGCSSDPSVSDSALFTPRKSNRMKKPKDFGPNMTVQNIFSPNKAVSISPSKVTKCVVNDGKQEYMIEIPKREVEDDYFSYATDEHLDLSSSLSQSSLQSNNTERFCHLLKQTVIFDDVVLEQKEDGMSAYKPDANDVLEINKIISHSNLPAVPNGLDNKYNLDRQSESSFCSPPSSLDIPGDPVVNTMGLDLHKLAKNAAVQTRVAIYDKLFTRLGVGMADEALGILSQLYAKVMNVTEISQEDLTNDLQTALDTILALKDVLEELGIMSKDAMSTALYQRSISIHSLDKAKKALKRTVQSTDYSLPSNCKRRKFEPFTKKRLTSQIVPLSNSHSNTVSDNVNQSSGVKYDVCDNTESSNPENLKHHHIVMEVASLPNEMTPMMNVAPMTLSSELLNRLQSKSGVIELNVVKEDGLLLNSDTPSSVEVIQQPHEAVIHSTGAVE